MVFVMVDRLAVEEVVVSLAACLDELDERTVALRVTSQTPDRPGERFVETCAMGARDAQEWTVVVPLGSRMASSIV